MGSECFQIYLTGGGGEEVMRKLHSFQLVIFFLTEPI